MSRTVRTFVAIEVPSAVQRQAVKLQERLAASHVAVKWVEEANIHLTLRFLGDVEVVQVPAVCDAVQRAAQTVAQFEMDLRGLGAFPHVRRPRTLWVGIDRGAEQLEAVHGLLEQELSRLGFPPEGRRFTPHVTIGRVRSGSGLGQLAELLAQHSEWAGGEVAVDEVVVMSSQLHPQGPQYTVLGRAQLRGSVALN